MAQAETIETGIEADAQVLRRLAPSAAFVARYFFRGFFWGLGFWFGLAATASLFLDKH